MTTFKYVVLLLVCMGCLPITLLAADPDTLSIQNDFIKVIINNQTADQGRFSVETTGGDPEREADDNQPLIFGRPKPWTSYTTFLIDGTPYIFGGPTKKRAGRQGRFGKVTGQGVTQNQLWTLTQFKKIRVKQTLSLFRNALTRVEDTALVTYKIQNLDTVTHNIGVRIMLDTMLGSNDAAPFRIGDQEYRSEHSFKGKEVMDFWQTFDHLTSPNVIAQGTLSFWDANVIAPNRMVLVNWGTLADRPWSFNYKEGRSFVREGELDHDTALGLYWDPITLAPGESRVVKTLYGLGGVTLVSGELSLGLAAPAEVAAASKSSILMVGYVLNTGGFDSKKTVLKFDLPQGLTLVDGQKEVSLGTIGAGNSRQVAIRVKVAPNAITGQKTIRVIVDSETLESNLLERSIHILGPPKVITKLVVPESVEWTAATYVDAVLSLSNQESYPIYDVEAYLARMPGIEVPPFELARKSLDKLGPYETVRVSWTTKLIRSEPRKRTIKVVVKSPVLQTRTLEKSVVLSIPKTQFYLTSSAEHVRLGDYFYVALKMIHGRPFGKQDLRIDWSPYPASYVRVSPSLWLLETDQLNVVKFIMPDHILLQGLQNKDYQFDQAVSKLHFRGVQKGKFHLTLSQGGLVLDDILVHIGD